MQQLVERIKRDGTVKPGGILKVDNFLNHLIDTQLCHDMAMEIHNLYAGETINKILTIEASGIGLAVMTGYVFGCPVLFAKKSKSANISDGLYSAEVKSYTHGNTNTVIVSKEYLNEGDKVLIIDDFLAMGEALEGLCSLLSRQEQRLSVRQLPLKRHSSRAAQDSVKRDFASNHLHASHQ